MPLSLDEFASQVSLSGLLTSAELEAVRAQSTAADAEGLARELVKQKKLTPFQAQQCFSGKGKSLMLGNYVLLEKLGQGGMGMVLKAQHKRMKRIVAIKVLAPNVAKNKDLVARFHREVEAAAKLEHPNVVAAYDADEANGVHFLVMQFVDGKDLSSLVKQSGPLSVERAVACVLDAAKGIQAAHERGITHRDIKPANLMVDRQGIVRVLDLGLARVASDEGLRSDLTGSGQVMGTIDYMAPEQALSAKSADHRADIYSLGVTLWYLLTAKPLFDGESLMAKLLAHRESPIPSLQSACPHVPAQLEALFRRMVAKHPAERFQSMREVITALSALVPQAAVRPMAAARAGAAVDVDDAPTVVPDQSVLAEAPTVPVSSPFEASRPMSMLAGSKTLPRKRGLQRGRQAAWFRQPRWIVVACVSVAVIILGVIATRDTSSTAVPSTATSLPPAVPAVSSPADLLARIDLVRHRLEGDWRRDGTALISPEIPFAQIALPGPPPAEYKLEVHATRVSGVGPLVIGLPFASSRCVAVIDASPATHLVTLGQFTGTLPEGALMASSGRGLQLGNRCRIECTVTTNSVQVVIDGERMLHYSGNAAAFSTPGYWKVADVRQGFLGSSLATFRMDHVSLQEERDRSGSPAR